MVHILFVGGEDKNLPTQNLRCKFTHYKNDSKQIRRGEIGTNHGSLPDMVMCFTDFVSHGTCEIFKGKAKAAHIPFIASRGGIGSLANAAHSAGHKYIYDHIVLNGSPKKKEEVKVKEDTPKDPSDNIDLGWVFAPPPQRACHDIVDGNRKITTLRTQYGISIMMKGDVLMDAIRIASDKKMGKGVRGQVTPQEADEIAKILDEKLGLAKRGIGISGHTIRRNIGIAFGNIAPGSTPVERAKQKREAKQKIVAETQKTEEKRETVKKAVKKAVPAKVVSGEGLETFLAQMALHIQGMDRRMDQLVHLYDRIAKLESDNATFVGQVVAFEDEVSKKDDEIEQLRAEITRLKRIIAEE